MIAEIKTVDPERGVIISQRKAMRLKREWNRGRLRAQERAQRSERRDAAGEEEEEGDNPMQDHPGKSCWDTHDRMGMSHDDFLDKQEEEEEEEHRNPLYRQNSAGARSISPSRRTRERER